VILAEGAQIAGLLSRLRIRNLLPQSGPIIRIILREPRLFCGRHNFANEWG
jgi:hypothetical protein